MTKREAAIASLYTGYMFGNFADMHEYAEEILGHPVYTHDFADVPFLEKARDTCKKDFVDMCRNIEEIPYTAQQMFDALVYIGMRSFADGELPKPESPKVEDIMSWVGMTVLNAAAKEQSNGTVDV